MTISSPTLPGREAGAPTRSERESEVWEYGSMGVWEYGSVGSVGRWPLLPILPYSHTPTLPFGRSDCMSNHDLDPALDPELDRVSRRRILETMSMSTIAAAVLGPEAMAQGKTPDALNDKSLVHEDITFPSGSDRVESFLCK